MMGVAFASSVLIFSSVGMYHFNMIAALVFKLGQKNLNGLKFCREFKKAEETLKRAKKEAEQHSKSWKQREQEFETLRLEVSELEQAVTNSKQQLEETVQATVGLQETLQESKDEHQTSSVSIEAFPFYY